MTSQLEFWFEFGSNYSYLSGMRIEAAAARFDVQVTWKPFLLGPIFKSFGWHTSPLVLQPEKGAYVWKDMVRQCKKYGLAWTQPTTFPRAALLPIRVALVGATQPWIGEFSKRIFSLNFVSDRDIDSREAVEEVLTQLNLPAAAILAEAQTEANKLRLREQTALARAMGIFGAPMFFVRGEMFWGNDRLEDALGFAAAG